MYIINTMNKVKEKKHIYPVEFDAELYSKLKEHSKEHGRQSIGSIIRYAVMLFLARGK